jgi:transcriptional regulator with XRE-family HTH domain
MTDIGQNIKELRKSITIGHSMSQADLAQKTGLEPSAISHFETGRRRPSLGNLKRLAEALGVSIDTLVYGKGNK